MYAFIEKEECPKEEKTFRQSWEITQITIFHFHAGLCRSFRKRNIVIVGLKNEDDNVRRM
ncbi:hypothetical protein COS86_05200 [Candidatus Bathyarchaeota archaeon CG07_land_8_20_14_0_80_47_9]|nr:MAG: hypothetical protein COS86_05200 [Candidatus Bathyarchaeota archaeon CG07_land_8_20_14_0_80_47_9]